MISLNEANAVPLYSVESQMVYALKGSDVRDVMDQRQVGSAGPGSTYVERRRD